ncbi:vertnin isoform X1 [Anolis carolinensis]|uniref:Vertnin n=2 Tax=Anolis carolinensis TaxID=28377 RepID=G1KSL7_ANOCA|nr:PREDICTED: vertnin isoform X1 [Anolis carolinensis]|eukprot:XP_008123038.1 PREDICTED: vertnin isoform X1 [Anolis carolinensis]
MDYFLVGGRGGAQTLSHTSQPLQLVHSRFETSSSLNVGHPAEKVEPPPLPAPGFKCPASSLARRDQRRAGHCLGLAPTIKRMIQRHQLVQCVLQELQDATECFGLDGLTSAALEAERTLSSFSLPNYCGRQVEQELEIDRVAKSLYPEDAPRRMLPLICKGEGNHLFEAASMLLWGNTSLSLELQVRTAVEMLLHKQYYLKGMIDSKVMLQAARYSLCTEESPEMTNLPLAVLEAIFDADIKATCFPGTYANMWHVYALASVVKCNIYSIYPMSNLKIRPYFNRLIRPRTCSMQVSTLHIMWSGQQLSSQVFKAQCFVPIVGLEEIEELEPNNPPPEPQVQPVKTLELLNKDPQVTYSDLRERYSITKSTFYRWKRQSREHRQKAAARFAAKHFLQSCFQEGNIVPLQHFRKMFPEISRSTYYAWKHEMQSMLNGNASSPAEGVVSKDPQVYKPEKVCAGTDGNITKPGGSLVSVGPLLNQNGTSMQGAKSYLENSISMNTLVPYRSFKRSFPGISRSTYYNWRRKAMKNPNIKPPQPLCVSQIPLMKKKPHLPLKPGNSPVGKMVNGYHPEPEIQVQIKPSLYSWQKQLRDLAKKHVCQWKMPFCKFRLRHPGVSSTAYWFWRKKISSPTKKHSLLPNGASKNFEQATAETREKTQFEFHSPQQKETVPAPVDKQMAQPHSAMKPGYQMAQQVSNDDMFVMDVIATAQFKAQAKLFLQQRFESKTFPTYKEFRARFPLTARSTYYMWKRALHDGLTLVDS